MSRPDYVTHEDIDRWSEKIDNDPLMSQGLAQNPIVREVCYAAEWLNEKLKVLNCPDEMIGRIVYTFGFISFGRDPWEVSQDLLRKYENSELEFEMDPDNIN